MIEDAGNDDELTQAMKVLLEAEEKEPTSNYGPITIADLPEIRTGPAIWASDFATRQQAVQDVAKADPNNIQEVAASQLSIVNSYYQSGLRQSQQSFRWSLIWGGIGLIFLIAAVSFLLIREPTAVAVASGVGGAFVEVFAGTYLYLYKHASDQLAAFRDSLESTQRLLLANSMCEKLKDELEQTTRSELIRLMVQSATHLPVKESQNKR